MGFFLTHRIKAHNFRGKFRDIFRKKIRSSKKTLSCKIHSADVPPWERKIRHVMYLRVEKFSPKCSSAENHWVTWGTWENKSPPHHVMLSFCCFCTRDSREPLIRLGDGPPLPISRHEVQRIVDLLAHPVEVCISKWLQYLLEERT